MLVMLLPMTCLFPKRWLKIRFQRPSPRSMSGISTTFGVPCAGSVSRSPIWRILPTTSSLLSIVAWTNSTPTDLHDLGCLLLRCGLPPLTGGASNDPTALERVIQGEALALAQAALDTLDLEKRAVFILHEIDGYSMPEVSLALEIPLNTAYSRLRLARTRFAAALKRAELRRSSP